VPLLLAERPDGRPKHLLLGYACHPTAAGGILEIGGDYPGFARVELEAALGCTVTFLLGCAGDQKPWRPVPGDGLFPQYPLAEVRRFGGELAAAAMREFGHGRWQPVTGKMQVRSRRVPLTMRELPRADYEAMLNHGNRWFERWARLNLARLDAGAVSPPPLDFEIQTAAFGDALVLVALAGEMNVEYGLRLARELGGRFAHVWPVGYANEIVGYVPAERQLPEGGYEVIGSQMYLGRPGPLEPGTEGKIMAAIREMLFPG
jgi:neutral ceramidase